MGGSGLVEAQLYALVEVSAAAAGAHRLEDVLELAAERALAAIGASSLSISRWQAGEVVTLINVGELGPGEERHPEDERYPLVALPAEPGGPERRRHAGLRGGRSRQRPRPPRAAAVAGQGDEPDGPDRLRGRDLGRAVGDLERRPGALRRARRRVPAGDRRPDRGRGRTRGAVRPGGDARLHRPADRGGQPARARGGARARLRVLAAAGLARAAALRHRRPQGDQRRLRSRRRRPHHPACGRCPLPGRRRPLRRGGGADGRRRVLRAAPKRRRRRGPRRVGGRRPAPAGRRRRTDHHGLRHRGLRPRARPARPRC